MAEQGDVRTDVPLYPNVNPCPNCARLREERDTFRDAMVQFDAEREAREILVANNTNAWTALNMIRDAIEALGPVGAVVSHENVRGPEPVHEAEALVAGIQALAAERDRARVTASELQKIAEALAELQARCPSLLYLPDDVQIDVRIDYVAAGGSEGTAGVLPVWVFRAAAEAAKETDDG